MENVGRALMVLGAVVFILGLIFTFQERLPFLRWLGRLPGDFSWGGDSWRVSMPLATSLILSAILTLGMWFLNWLSSRGGK